MAPKYFMLYFKGNTDFSGKKSSYFEEIIDMPLNLQKDCNGKLWRYVSRKKTFPTMGCEIKGQMYDAVTGKLVADHPVMGLSYTGKIVMSKYKAKCYLEALISDDPEFSRRNVERYQAAICNLEQKSIDDYIEQTILLQEKNERSAK